MSPDSESPSSWHAQYPQENVAPLLVDSTSPPTLPHAKRPKIIGSPLGSEEDAADDGACVGKATPELRGLSSVDLLSDLSGKLQVHHFDAVICTTLELARSLRDTFDYFCARRPVTSEVQL